MQMKYLTSLACIAISAKSFACIDDNGVSYDLILSQYPNRTCQEVIADKKVRTAQEQQEDQFIARESELEARKTQLKEKQDVLRDRAWNGDVVIAQYCGLNGNPECVELPTYIGMQFEIENIQSQLVEIWKIKGKQQHEAAKMRREEEDQLREIRKRLNQLDKTYMQGWTK